MSCTRVVVALSIIFSSFGRTNADPVVIAVMEGYSLWQGQENTIGINNLNSTIRDRMAGENYFSRVFEWDDVDEATNYFNLFDSSENYLIGYSRGGYQALRVAEGLRQDGIQIQGLAQLDPVRCDGTENYAADNVLNCRLTNPFQPVSSIFSSGPQIVPGNVSQATNYYQTGGGITGEQNVVNASNVNVNDLYNDPTINHSTIDDNLPLRRRIVDQVFGLRDSNVLMGGLGGASGFGTLAMTRNDDGSTDAISLPFEVNLNGREFSTLYINNNGNVTFGGPYSEFTPESFGDLDVEMIAPFWGDVDTRCANCGEVYLSVPTADSAVITWNDVGFYDSDPSKKNSFQLILRDRNDFEGANTDVEFRYGSLQWTTGDASGGEDGLGGQPAFAGYTGGAGAPQTLNGSGTASVLTLNQRSNIGKPGKWLFAFRDGSSPGVTRENPLLPDVQEDGWHFQFTTTVVEEIVWSDPELVFGYQYEMESGASFRSFVLPELGDNTYELWLGDTTSQEYIADVVGGVEYLFSDLGFDDGVDFFQILGVDSGLAISPNDVTAFVTGLSFTEIGQMNWVQRPLSVPEPNCGALLLVGLIISIRRRDRTFMIK